MAGISVRCGDVQPTSVQRANDDLRAQRTVDDVSVFILEIWCNEPGRDEDHAPLTRHPGNTVDRILKSAERDAAFVLARSQYARTEGIYEGCGSSEGHATVPYRCVGATFTRLNNGNLRGVTIAFVNDQIGLVVTNFRTLVCEDSRADRPWLQTEQGFVELSPVICKVQCRNP
jgi:hypothetical protein